MRRSAPSCPGQPCGFGCRPLIAPDERGAENAIVLIQQNGAMHLTAQADGGDLFRAGRGLLQQGGNGVNGRLPPVFRILLRPARLWRAKGSMLTHCRADHFSCRVYQQDARAAGADVDSDQFHGSGVRFVGLSGLTPAATRCRRDRYQLL